MQGQDRPVPPVDAGARRAGAPAPGATGRELLAGLADGCTDAIIGTSLDGTVRVWNEGAARLYGWSAEDMLGHSVYRLVPQARQSEADQAFARARRGDASRETIARRRHKDGRLIDVAYTLTPVRGPGSELLGIVSVERDVTRRRRLEALAEGQRRVLEALAESGRLQDALRDMLTTVLELTGGVYEAAIMQVSRERLLLTPALTSLPDELERRLGEGIPVAPGGHPAGEAAFQRQVVSIADLQNEPGWDSLRKAVLAAGLASCCSAPISAPGGEVLGSIDVYRREPGEPSGEDLEVISAFARTAAIAMQRHETEHELVLGREVLQALNEINALLVADPDIGRVLRRVTEEATRLLDAQMGAFLTIPTEPGATEFEPHTIAGVAASTFEDLARPRVTSLFSGTIHGRAVQRFNDVTRDPRYGKNEPYTGIPEGHPPVRSFMSAPVSARSGEVIGMLLFAHEQPGRFARMHEEILRGAAAQMALALDSANLYRQASERAEALAEADRRKDDFLAMLGHELRNPLGAMIAGLAVIDSNLPEEAEEGNEAMHIFRRQARHMQRLIDDLLDANRVRRGEIRLQRAPMDVVSATREAVEAARIPALKQAQNIVLSVEQPEAWIDADAVRIGQVIGNLLNNATKFSPRNSTIHVIVRSQGDEVSILVKDQGCGMQPEEVPGIFDMFAQVRDPGAPGVRSGLGLGLTLVRELVQLHGGWVTARSEGRGKGSEFVIRLPRIEPPRVDDADGADGERRGPLPVLRVLLAEDQPDAARAMTMLLRHWGHKVIYAENGRAALELALRRKPDVGLLDIGLPGMTGWEVAQGIREAGIPEGIRLAALTGWGQSFDFYASRAAGFDHHFVKPVDPDELKTWLDTVAATIA
ncbi:MAG: GAF domain-containing protein [Planctomycetota bacterium]|nr:GAF domain-containing protein [Planctomycetota bacterium]